MSNRASGDFNALVVVSPLQLGGETKDQDRARWFSATRIAAVCDGLTSSPYSDQAAQLAVSLSPQLFGGEPAERMCALSDLLIAERLEAQLRPVKVPGHVSAGMRAMLQETAQHCLASAFQTTLVATAFMPIGTQTSVSIVRCGDSAFLAFTPAGTLLGASPAFSCNPGGDSDATNAGNDDERIRFGPGDQLLVKVLGTAKRQPALIARAALNPRHAANWLVCQPLDHCDEGKVACHLAEPHRTHRLAKRDLLLVPRYLPERIDHPSRGKYARLCYSSTVRVMPPDPALGTQGLDFKAAGSVTAVVPDHVRAGRWEYLQERYPADTHFVLATDGFYSSFDDPSELHTWLTANKCALRIPEERDIAMRDRHLKLHARRGDDDMAFVWVRPRRRRRNRTEGSENHEPTTKERSHAGRSHGQMAK